MRKLRSEFPVTNRYGYRRYGMRTWVVILGIVLLLPILYEVALSSVANWRSIWGPTQHVETPVLLFLGHVWHDLVRSTGTRSAAIFARVPWQPSLVITVGILWAIFMSVPLRRH